MKILICILTFLIGSILTFFLVANRAIEMQNDTSKIELIHLRGIVEKQVSDIAVELSQKVKAFSNQIPNDRDFTIKLLVENDRSAPEVSELCGMFLAPMGFDILEIVDSAGTIISSGHFPASAGNLISGKIANLTTDAAFYFDTIKGEKVLSLQALAEFKIADRTFYTCGGILINKTFLDRLSPRSAIQLILNHEDFDAGTQGIQSMSDITDNTILVNNEEHLAVAIPLPFAGEQDAPELIVLMEKPAPITAFSLLWK